MKIANCLVSSLTLAIGVSMSGMAAAAPSLVQLDGVVPTKAIAKAIDLGPASATQNLSLAIPLRPRHLTELETLIQRLYTPGDALYGKYLTPEDFTARFAPTQAQYDSVVNYLQSKGLTNIKISPGRMVVNVSATVTDVESALGVRFHRYLSANGRNVFAPTVEPTVDASVAKLIYGIVGMNNFATPKKHFVRAKPHSNPAGNGPDFGGLTALNIRTAYQMTEITQTGAGQTLGLAEFDGYTLSDITAYAQSNNLGNLNLKNVYVDGFDGTPSDGDGAAEVTLDIQLMAAIAPAATIVVYQAPSPSDDQSFESAEIDVYNKIATDNLAKVVSSSWGLAEDSIQPATMKAENTSFMQMATQGQSMYAASGDAGAYDDGINLSVDDPSSQPYVTASGGTTLTLSPSLAYLSETSWNTSSVDSDNGPEGGGGGISTVWPIPSWQQNLGTTGNKGSTTMRMVPDVSLDADPATGYSFYYGAAWGVVGGTSCVGPILAGFTGLVNQARATAGRGSIGYMNPAFYQIGASKDYSTVFHDIADNSTNLYFPAVQGYDLSTGLGTLIGGAAFPTLVGLGGSN